MADTRSFPIWTELTSGRLLPVVVARGAKLRYFNHWTFGLFELILGIFIYPPLGPIGPHRPRPPRVLLHHREELIGLAQQQEGVAFLHPILRVQALSQPFVDPALRGRVKGRYRRGPIGFKLVPSRERPKNTNGIFNFCDSNTFSEFFVLLPDLSIM